MSEKLKNMLGDGWYNQLSPFLNSEKFISIGKELSYQSKQLKEITPSFTNIFRAFKECSWERIHTVILGMDPYGGKIGNEYIADGIAFSSRTSKTCPASLNHIIRAIEESILNGESYDLNKYPNYDLTRWSNQGILLINCALSLPLKEKAGTHIPLWTPFITEVLSIINKHKDCIAIGLMGAHAKKYRSLLTNESFAIYESDHPASAVYRGGVWKHNNILSSIDGYHKFKNNIIIKW
jgi:uracil-DNA glycosylase